MPARSFHRVLPACVLLGLLAPGVSMAAAGIVIDEDLRSGGDMYKVSLGMQKPGRTWSFKFGDYSIVSSKTTGAVTTTTWGGEHQTRQEFSFVMKGADPATVEVSAVQNGRAEDIRDLSLGGGFAIDLEAIAGGTDHLAASIRLDGDQGEPWMLLLNVERRMANTIEETNMSLLASGEREIRIEPVTSDPPGAKPSSLPARGYQFFEADRPIAAVQYLGAGVLGFNKNVVYLRRDLDPGTRLMLAAAMAAIMQAKINAMAE